MPAAGTATLTFGSVAVAGATTIAVLESPPELAQGYLQAGASFYDIETTAQFAGDVQRLPRVTRALVADPVRLLHHDGVGLGRHHRHDRRRTRLRRRLDALAVRGRDLLAAALLDTFIDVAPPSQTVNPIASFSFSSNDGARVLRVLARRRALQLLLRDERVQLRGPRRSASTSSSSARRTAPARST